MAFVSIEQGPPELKEVCGLQGLHSIGELWNACP
jgi:hypothetical protein